jgi:triphosphatase
VKVSNTERAFVRKAAALSGAPGDWRDASEKAATPLRVHLVRLPVGTAADHALSTVMALHASVIAHNLTCVLTSLDPEGPHQLRVALRRVRVALRVFRPVMKKGSNDALAAAARDLGAIVGELRDADVLIDEIIAPSARGPLVTALNAWRQEVRGRVRARLSAASAHAFAESLAADAATAVWSKKTDLTLEAMMHAAIDDFRETVAQEGARLPHLAAVELHQLRKNVKALRYGTELAVAAGLATSESVRPLKRMQDLLGYANDMASLANFDPPIFAGRADLQQLRERLIAERAERVSASAQDAAAEWRNLTREWAAERGAKV